MSQCTQCGENMTGDVEGLKLEGWGVYCSSCAYGMPGDLALARERADEAETVVAYARGLLHGLASHVGKGKEAAAAATKNGGKPPMSDLAELIREGISTKLAHLANLQIYMAALASCDLIGVEDEWMAMRMNDGKWSMGQPGLEPGTIQPEAFFDTPGEAIEAALRIYGG